MASVGTRWFAALTVVVALFGACGGNDGDDTAADVPPMVEDEVADEQGDPGAGDGCEIVTQADAEAVLGEPVTQADDPSAALAGETQLMSCVWEVQKTDSFKLLQFRVFNGAHFYTPDAYRNEESYEEIDGLGEEAFLIESLGLQLWVLDGDRTISLDASGFNVDDPGFNREEVRQALLDLASDVLGRM